MKLKHSLVALATLTTLSFAGGDINPVTVFEAEPAPVPVEPVVVPVAPAPAPTPKAVPAPVPVAPVAEPLGIYLSGGFTDVAVSTTQRANLFKSQSGQGREVGFTGRLGYDFMDYLGAELRGTYGIAKNSGTKFKQIGAYLKPNYDVTDAINLYGLLGASKTNFSGAAASDTGFSYGAGLDYGLTDNISVFTDVVNYMKKSGTPSTWGLTLGAGYQF